MNDDQKDITEEQRLQQAQSTGTSSTAPAGGQSSFSADYSATQQAQDDGATAQTAEVSVSDEQDSGVVTEDNTSSNNEFSEVPSESNEEDDTAAMMNDYAEDGLDDLGEEEIDESEEEATEEDSFEEEVQVEEDLSSNPGSVVGPDGQIGAVQDSSIVGSDQQVVSDGSSDLDVSDMPAPDLTPEIDSTLVDAAIDGAFDDFNNGDADLGDDVLGGGAND